MPSTLPSSTSVCLGEQQPVAMERVRNRFWHKEVNFTPLFSLQKVSCYYSWAFSGCGLFQFTCVFFCYVSIKNVFLSQWANRKFYSVTTVSSSITRGRALRSSLSTLSPWSPSAPPGPKEACLLRTGSIQLCSCLLGPFNRNCLEGFHFSHPEAISFLLEFCMLFFIIGTMKKSKVYNCLCVF